MIDYAAVHRRVSLALLVWSTLSVWCCMLQAQHPDDKYWDSGFGYSLITNEADFQFNHVNALAVSGDYVLVGGRFTQPTKRLAIWNKRTNTWLRKVPCIPAVETSSNAQIFGITVVQERAYVRGLFTDSLRARQLSFGVLDLATMQWLPDTSFVGSAYDMCRMGNDLIVSGSFRISGTDIRNCAIVRNGSWLPFSADSANNLIGQMTVFRDTLYLVQTTFGSSRVQYSLKKWSGSAWLSVIDSTHVVSGTSSVCQLHAGKNMLAVTLPCDSIYPTSKAACGGHVCYVYDGQSWVSPVDNIVLTPVLATYQNPSVWCGDNDVYLFGPFTSINGFVVSNIARWNRTTKAWTGIAGGVSDGVNAFLNPYRTIFLDSNDVYVGGTFSKAGGKRVQCIARYSLSANEWFALTSPDEHGLDAWSRVSADKGKLLAVGAFISSGVTTLNGIANWTGTQWSPLGVGIPNGFSFPADGKNRVLDGTVDYSVQRFQDTLVIGGAFGVASGVECDNIVQFDRGNIRCFGGGIRESHAGSFGQYVQQSCVADLCAWNGQLVAAGDFLYAGADTVNSIAAWNGSKWQSMADDIATYSYASLRLLIDSTHHLLCTGSIRSLSGVPCNGVLRWNGTSWDAVGYVGDDPHRLLTAACVAANGDIIVAGNFQVKNDLRVNGLARWDGSSWHSLGSGMDDTSHTITAMAARREYVYVAGNFNSIGGIAAHNVARFNLRTNQWSALGSGFATSAGTDTLAIYPGYVNSIAFIGDTVFFGGSFMVAGLKPSRNIAAWHDPSLSGLEWESALAGDVDLCIIPNPVAQSCSLRFSVPRPSVAHLQVFDIMGNEQRSLLHEQLDAGTYTLQANTEGLSNGVYMLRLMCNGQSLIRILCIQR